MEATNSYAMNAERHFRVQMEMEPGCVAEAKFYAMVNRHAQPILMNRHYFAKPPAWDPNIIVATRRFAFRNVGNATAILNAPKATMNSIAHCHPSAIITLSFAEAIYVALDRGLDAMVFETAATGRTKTTVLALNALATVRHFARLHLDDAFSVSKYAMELQTVQTAKTKRTVAHNFFNRVC